MIIEYDENFTDKFNVIWDFIRLDSQNRANDFKTQLKKQIENIPHFPSHLQIPQNPHNIS